MWRCCCHIFFACVAGCCCNRLRLFCCAHQNCLAGGSSWFGCDNFICCCQSCISCWCGWRACAMNCGMLYFCSFCGGWCELLMRSLGLCCGHMWYFGIRYALERKIRVPGWIAIHFNASDQVGRSCFPYVALCTRNANTATNVIRKVWHGYCVLCQFRFSTDTCPQID